MRIIPVLFFLFCTSYTIVSAQQLKIPVQVKKSFEQRYPNAKAVNWSFNQDDKLWDVVYEKEALEYSSSFSEAGDWLQTDINIKITELPDAVMNTLREQFLEYDIEEIERLETPEGLFYEIEVGLEEGSEERDYELTISQDGTVIMQKEENKE